MRRLLVLISLLFVASLVNRSESASIVKASSGGASFATQTGCTTDAAGTITCTTFTTSGAGAGYSQWTTGAMAVGAAGTVKCGANTGDIFSCSDAGGAVTALPFLANHLGGTQALPQIIGLGLTKQGSIGNQSMSYTIANHAATGTGQGLLAVYATSLNDQMPKGAAAVTTAPTTHATGIIGVVTSGAGTTGNAEVAWAGIAQCVFDADGATIGHYVVASHQTAGNCRMAGNVWPTTSHQVIGRSLSTIAPGGGSGNVLLYGPEIGAGGAITYPLTADNGSKAAPSYSFSSDTDTGIWWRSAGIISFAANGANVAEILAVSAFSGFQIASVSGQGPASVVFSSGEVDSVAADVGLRRMAAGVLGINVAGTGNGALQIGDGTLTLTGGALGMFKITASGTAPGAAGAKFEVVCGTNAGTLKLIMYGGTSTTPTTVIDNVGGGATGC